jgi:cytochrome P450
MAPYFSPKKIREFEPTVREITRDLLRPFVEVGEIDIAAELARPLPARVICSWLGFPPDDYVLLETWFAAMLERIPGQVEAPATAWEANDAMRAYIAEAAREREQSPRDDLMSVLVAGEREGHLSSDEIIGMAIFLFYAGIISTAGLISNSLLNLPRFPDQLRLIAGDASLIPTAVEELLRHEAPIQSLRRIAQNDSTLHGESVPSGAQILLIWGSANRDEARWEQPERIDFTRHEKRHLAFGEGIHYCIGAPLARLEGKVAFEEVLPLMPEYDVLEPYERIYTPHERGLKSLRLRFTPRNPVWL